MKIALKFCGVVFIAFIITSCITIPLSYVIPAPLIYFFSGICGFVIGGITTLVLSDWIIGE